MATIPTDLLRRFLGCMKIEMLIFIGKHDCLSKKLIYLFTDKYKKGTSRTSCCLHLIRLHPSGGKGRPSHPVVFREPFRHSEPL